MVEEQKKLLSLLKAGNVKRMQQSSHTMEKENIEMEKKLGSLKEKLKKDREEWEKMGGPKWKSSLLSTKKSTGKSNSSKRTVKVLTDQPIENYKVSSVSVKENKSFQLCGQCDHRKAKVECNECTEYYCSLCYKDFHSKGALRKHTWKAFNQSTQKSSGSQNSKKNSTSMKKDYSAGTDIDAKDISVSGCPVPKTPTLQLLPSGRSSSLALTRKTTESQYMLHNSHETNKIESFTSEEVKSTLPNVHRNDFDRREVNKPSLLNGFYDEEENAVAFQQALMEWRNAGEQKPHQQKEMCAASVGTDRSHSQASSEVQINVNFNSNPNISYLDRIMLKRHQQNPQEFLSNSSKLPSKVITDKVNGISLKKSPTPPQQQKSDHSSTRLLSMRYSPRDKLRPVEIDIYPFDDDNDDFNDIDSSSTPIITTSHSDEDCLQKQPTTLHMMQPQIIELNFVCNEDTNTESLSHNNKVLHQPSTVPSQQIHKQNDVSLKNVVDYQQAGIQDKIWRPSNVYQSMNEYFLLGVTGPENSERGSNEIINSKDIPLLTSNSDSQQWEHRKSFDQNLTWSSSYDSDKRKSSYDISTHGGRLDAYDYLQAPPPISKGDNYHKLHRCSSALSISALPVDVWMDSDTSQPSSRRTSYQPVSRKVSEVRRSKERAITEFNEDSTDAVQGENTQKDEVVVKKQLELGPITQLVDIMLLKQENNHEDKDGGNNLDNQSS